MKTIKFLALGLLISFSTVSGQVTVNVNPGTPPVWAPADRVATQYYYLPEIDTYYDVPSERFIYANNGTWIRSKNLPARHRGYALRGSRIVYLTDYKGKTPYKYHKAHKVKYKGNNGNHYGHGKGKAKGKDKKNK